MKINRIAARLMVAVLSFALIGAITECEASRIIETREDGRREAPPIPPPTPYVAIPQVSPNGEYIIFEYHGSIFSVRTNATRLLRIPDAPSAPDFFMRDFSPDISPDGSRVVYRTFRYHTGGLLPWNRRYSYEIATSKPDGGDAKRITKDEHGNVNPVWSPDGSRIAFVSHRGESAPTDAPPAPGIYTVGSDGSDEKLVALGGRNRGTTPEPVWSPDGRYIAFRDYDHDYSDEEGASTFQYFLAVVGVDGSGFRKVAKSDSVISMPAWSPDSRRIAFRAPEDGMTSTALYTFDVYEDAARKIFASTFASHPRRGHEFEMFDYRASWTADGDEIVFYGNAPDLGFHMVKADGTDFRSLPIPLGDDAEEWGYASGLGWTLDGSRLVILHLRALTPFRQEHEHGDVVLRSINLDGTGETVLARHAFGEIVSENSGWESQAPDCASGTAVPDPQFNTGLVRDCEILLSARDALAGEGASLNWQPHNYIGSWTGVRLDSLSRRVERLEFHHSLGDGQSLSGSMPAEIGELTELKIIDIPSQSLSGEIPPELGNLAKLERLLLIRNRLSGSIPPELGNLANLEELYLAENQLTGSVPPELGNLKNLKNLTLHTNNLSGCLPAWLTDNPNLSVAVYLEPC